MYRVLSLCVAVAGFALAQPATAATVLFQGLGLFSSSAPTSAHTAPGKSFSFSFDLEDPVPVSSQVGDILITTAATNFVYKLDGVAQVVTLQYVDFQPAGFVLLFADQTEFDFVGPDLGASGTLLAPSQGSYLLTVSLPSPRPPSLRAPQSSLTAATPQVLGTATVVTSIAGVPEPATWGLLIIGFGATGAALRRRRRPAHA